VGSDASAEAITVARANAQLLGIDVEFDTVSGIPSRQYDLVVTNPPYARDDELVALGKEISSYQPHLALVGGTDGLDVLRSIIATGKRGTRLATEHDRAQTGAVHTLLSDAVTRDDPHTASSVTVGLVT
jgi:methylase of polypeptide subunit release factors